MSVLPNWILVFPLEILRMLSCLSIQHSSLFHIPLAISESLCFQNHLVVVFLFLQDTRVNKDWLVVTRIASYLEQKNKLWTRVFPSCRVGKSVPKSPFGTTD